MAKDRIRPCKFYKAEHDCTKGKDAEFWGVCQHCPNYVKELAAAPARQNKKRYKIQELREKDMYDY